MSVLDVPLIEKLQSRRDSVAPRLFTWGAFLVMLFAVAACGVAADSQVTGKDSGANIQQGADAPVSSAETPPDTDPDIWKETLEEVSRTSVRYGGPEHGTAEYVIAERNSALNALSGDSVSADGKAPDQDEVYVFMLRGSFTAKYARVPPGAELPTGTAVVFTVSRGPSAISDTDAPVVLDAGLLKSAPELSAVSGSVTEIQF